MLQPDLLLLAGLKVYPPTVTGPSLLWQVRITQLAHAVQSWHAAISYPLLTTEVTVSGIQPIDH